MLAITLVALAPGCPSPSTCRASGDCKGRLLCVIGDNGAGRCTDPSPETLDGEGEGEGEGEAFEGRCSEVCTDDTDCFVGGDDFFIHCDATSHCVQDCATDADCDARFAGVTACGANADCTP